MSAALVLAAGLTMGADWRLLAMAGGAIWVPVPTAVAVAGVAVVGQRMRLASALGQEARFVETVVGELRAGGSLRAALRTACAGRPECAAICRRLDVGQPLADAVAGLTAALPTVGHLVEAAVAVGAGGGRMIPVFEEMVVIATADEMSQAELRTATAQVRASMWVLIGGPLLYLAWALATGRLERLMGLPGGAVVGSVGAGLFLTGVVAMLWVGRR